MSLFAKILTFDFAQEICHSNVWTNKLPRISEFSYFIFLWKIHIENDSVPFISEKKNSLDYRVHCIQIDRLGLTVSTQKTIWKICTEARENGQNVSNFAGLVWKANFWHFFGVILGLGAYFLKLIFALKPWVWAGRFEYNEPYNLNNIFSLIKGSDISWKLQVPS